MSHTATKPVTKVIIHGYNKEHFSSSEHAKTADKLYIFTFDSEDDANLFLKGAQAHDDIINCDGLHSNDSISYEMKIETTSTVVI